MEKGLISKDGTMKSSRPDQEYTKYGDAGEPAWENIRNYYRIKGDGVAELKLYKAVRSEKFKASVKKLSDFKIASKAIPE